MGKLTALKEKLFPSNASYSRKDQLGYCGGIFGNCMGQDCIETYGDLFFRTYMHIQAKHMTLYGNIALALGLLTGALSGYILDTPAKPGRLSPAKTITGIMPIPFAVTSMLLFVVPSTDPFKNFIWMLAFHLIFNVADTFYDNSLNTLSLRITSDPHERKSFYTVGTLASSLGSMLPGWLLPMLVGDNKSGDVEKKVYFYVALAFCIIGVVLMSAPFFLMKEHVPITERSKKEKIAWDKQTVLAMLHNRPFIITEVATFFEQIRQLSYRLINYMYKNVLSAFKMKPVIDCLSGTLSFAGLLAAPFLNEHLPSNGILSGGFAYTGLFYSLIGLLGLRFDSAKMHKRRWLVGLLIGLSGMPNYGLNASKKMLVGDSIDYMEWYSEKQFSRPIHAEGFIAGAQSFFGTVFNLIRTNLYNKLFEKIDFKPNYIDAMGREIKVTQSESTLRGIFRMFVLFGVIGNFCAAITYLFDNYKGKKKDRIAAELAQMRARRKLVDAAAAYAEI